VTPPASIWDAWRPWAADPALPALLARLPRAELLALYALARGRPPRPGTRPRQIAATVAGHVRRRAGVRTIADAVRELPGPGPVGDLSAVPVEPFDPARHPHHRTAWQRAGVAPVRGR
jgi:hypothetical protein